MHLLMKSTYSLHGTVLCAVCSLYRVQTTDKLNPNRKTLILKMVEIQRALGIGFMGVPTSIEVFNHAGIMRPNNIEAESAHVGGGSGIQSNRGQSAQ